MACSRYFLFNIGYTGKDEICIFSRARGGKSSDEDPGGRIIRISGCCEFACLAAQAASESTYLSQVPYSPQVARPIRQVQKPVRKKR